MTLQLRFAQDPSVGAMVGAKQGAAVQGGDSMRDIEVASSLKHAGSGGLQRAAAGGYPLVLGWKGLRAHAPWHRWLELMAPWRRRARARGHVKPTLGTLRHTRLSGTLIHGELCTE